MLRKLSLVGALLGLACLTMFAAFADAGHRRGGGCGGYGGGGYYGGYAYADGYGSYGYAGMPYVNGGVGARTSFYPSSNQQGELIGQNQQGGAMVRIILPDPQARVFFDGTQTQQTGPDRLFQTPPLDASATNSYRIKATWSQGGKEVTQERTVNVSNGRTTLVDFVRPASEQIPQGQQPPRPNQPRELEGKIISTGQDQFVIETRDNRKITVFTNPQTTFLMNDKTVAFTDLRTGATVTTGFTMQGDRHIANRIVIRP
jgi:uncharacterized protein (TIGR03000 family)